MYTFHTSLHLKTLQHKKHLRHFNILHGALPLTPKLWRLLKFPVAGISFSRTESDCQGHKCRKTACFAPLDRLPSASALRSSSDGDLFILQSQIVFYFQFYNPLDE